MNTTSSGRRPAAHEEFASSLQPGAGHVQVFIVGAGPVGMTLAAGLCQSDVQTRIPNKEHAAQNKEGMKQPRKD